MYNKNVVFITVGIAMMLTGILYALDPIYTAGMMVKAIGYDAFIVWCGALVWGGFGMVINPQRILVWMLPLFGLSIPLVQLVVMAIEGLEGGSLTAILFYSVIPITAYYMWIIEYTDYPPLFEIRYLIGTLHVLMFFSLAINPDGAGLGLLNNAIRPLMPLGYDPSLFYRNLYLFTSLTLFSPILSILFKKATGVHLPYPEKRVAMRLCVSPFMIHGLTFLFVIAFESYAWLLAPMLFAVPVCLFITMRVYSYD